MGLSGLLPRVRSDGSVDGSPRSAQRASEHRCHSPPWAEGLRVLRCCGSSYGPLLHGHLAAEHYEKCKLRRYLT